MDPCRRTTQSLRIGFAAAEWSAMLFEAVDDRDQMVSVQLTLGALVPQEVELRIVWS